MTTGTAIVAVPAGGWPAHAARGQGASRKAGPLGGWPHAAGVLKECR